MRANREAFDHWRLRPRMLRDVSERSLGRTVLGNRNYLEDPVFRGLLEVSTSRGDSDKSFGHRQND